MLAEELLPYQIILGVAETYQAHISKRTQFIYLLVLTLLTATAASLPFIHISVIVKSFAFIRPVTEVSLIRSPSNGRIVEVAIRENQPVQKDEVLFVIESDVLNQKEVAFVIRMEDAESVIYDLRRLTTSTETFSADSLITIFYRQSLQSFNQQMPQKIDLFAGNVIENIAVGNYQPDMKKIIGICSALGIMDFIEKLPNNFNTYLGENGATLSGGQKQRIAIARALYKEPEILILDEATSSLDSSSEHYVQRTIEVLKQRQRTIILIAHRLSSVSKADKIIVLKKGDVVEQGNHEALMKKRNHYFHLWKQQFPLMEEIV